MRGEPKDQRHRLPAGAVMGVAYLVVGGAIVLATAFLLGDAGPLAVALPALAVVTIGGLLLGTHVDRPASSPTTPTDEKADTTPDEHATGQFPVEEPHVGSFRLQLLPEAKVVSVDEPVARVLGHDHLHLSSDPNILLRLLGASPGDQIDEAGASVADRPQLVRWMTDEGHTAWVELRGNLVEEDDGRRVLFEGVLRDVTELAQTRSTTGIVAEIDQTLLEGAPMDAVFSRVCSRLRRDLGVPVVWIAGWTPDRRVTVEAVDTGFRSAAEVTQLLATMSNDHPIMRAMNGGVPDDLAPGDTPIFQEATSDPALLAIPIRFADGVHAALCVHAPQARTEDEHLRTTAAVVANHLALAWSRAEEQGWLRLTNEVLTGTETAVMITDRSGVIQWVNRAFEELTGWNEEDARGRLPSILKSGQESEHRFRELWDTIAGGDTWRGMMVNRRRDGETFRAHLTVAPVRDDKGRITRFVCLQEDLSAIEEAKARAEEARGEAMRKLQEDRTALVQTVSHEIRTPLTVIRGVGQTLLRGREVKDEQKEVLLSSLRRATDDLDEKLQLVMATTETISRADRIPTQVVDVPTLMREVSLSLDRDHGPERILWDGPDELTVVSVESAIRTVLRAVTHNSLRFSPENSKVEVSGWRDGEEVILQVRDYGPGIEEGFLDQATELFTQGDQSTTRARGGLGIGLSVAKNLVTQVGGTFTLENATDGKGGAVATIRLPQRRDIDQAVAAGAESADPVDGDEHPASTGSQDPKLAS